MTIPAQTHEILCLSSVYHYTPVTGFSLLGRESSNCPCHTSLWSESRTKNCSMKNRYMLVDAEEQAQGRASTDMHTPAHEVHPRLWGTHSSPSLSDFLTLIKKIRETKACSTSRLRW